MRRVRAASKSAVIGFTRACAAHYASRNIRFNALAPALVETPMARRAANDPQILAFIKTKQPLDGGRIGWADDLDAAPSISRATVRVSPPGRCCPWAAAGA